VKRDNDSLYAETCLLNIIKLFSMPVIIRELIIHATVKDVPVDTDNNESSSAFISAKEKEALVKECVEQVLEILEKRKENKAS